MAEITLRVLEGADRGRVYESLATPITIGREEGNSIQLNDERISRFHVKVQDDQDKLVLTDLESTNGSKVNGEGVYKKFRALLKESGLKPKVMITGCGSIGFCDRGVAVAVYPEDVWYSRVTEDDVEELFTEHVVNGRVVERLRDELEKPVPDEPRPKPFTS